LNDRLGAVRGAVVILLAAGSGERLGLATPKAFVQLAGRPMLVHAATSALECPDVASILAVVPAGWEGAAHELLDPIGPHAVVSGGATRQASVRAALAVESPGDVLVCHDAARPFASPALYTAVVSALAGVDGAVPVLAVADTVKRVRGGIVDATEPRDGLALAQTPQAFIAPALRDAHDRAEREGIEVTDDAAALEWAGYRVSAVPGEAQNFKVTTPEDLARAELVASELAHG
jgi:2-C-methyl-D-erythritol 4-phosphate cytidylyltransferase/2-C-methyl-D-erythritol 2,4-cyclodiphosphate synthase